MAGVNVQTFTMMLANWHSITYMILGFVRKQ